MATQRFTKQFATMVETAGTMAVQTGADAILVLLEGATDWEKLRQSIPKTVEHIIVATDLEEDLNGAEASGLSPLPLHKEKSPLLERLQHALLEAVADGFLKSNGDVIAVYSGFEHQKIDSISHLRLDDRLRRLTTRDLQRLESSVPLKTLKTVIDLAAQIGARGVRARRWVPFLSSVTHARYCITARTADLTLYEATSGKPEGCLTPESARTSRKLPKWMVHSWLPRMESSSEVAKSSKCPTPNFRFLRDSVRDTGQGPPFHK